MPFVKTHEVTAAFFDFFLTKAVKKTVSWDNRQHSMIPIQIHTGEMQDFLVRYYNRSGENSVEEMKETFPCVVIQDFQPEVDKTKVYGKGWLEGAIDEVSGTRELITLPIPMTFKFLVSGVTNRRKHMESLSDWFMEHLTLHVPGCFVFNKLETDEGFVGDIVPYTCEQSTVPRDDNRFEYQYSFDLDTFVHARAKDYTFGIPVGETEGVFMGGTFEDMVETIRISLSIKDYRSINKVLQHNFELT